MVPLFGDDFAPVPLSSALIDLTFGLPIACLVRLLAGIDCALSLACLLLGFAFLLCVLAGCIRVNLCSWFAALLVGNLEQALSV